MFLLNLTSYSLKHSLQEIHLQNCPLDQCFKRTWKVTIMPHTYIDLILLYNKSRNNNSNAFSCNWLLRKYLFEIMISTHADCVTELRKVSTIDLNSHALLKTTNIVLKGQKKQFWIFEKDQLTSYSLCIMSDTAFQIGFSIWLKRHLKLKFCYEKFKIKKGEIETCTII